MDIWQIIIENLGFIILGLFVILILIGICIANFSMDSYINAYEENKKIETSFWASSLEFTQYVSENKFNKIIKTTTTKDIQNFYTPAQETVTLSEDIAYSNSIAGIAIASHELGHAIQHFENPDILINNYKFDRFVKFLGNMNLIIMLLSIILTFCINIVCGIVGLGIILINFIIAIALKLSTVKLEKNASQEAIKMIKSLKIFNNDEIIMIKKFMNAAKRTYTADFLSALLSWTGLVRKTKFFS